MFDFIFKIWWMVAVLPYLAFLEINQMLIDFFKKRGVHWDLWYSLLMLFILLLCILLFTGYY